MPEDLPMRLRAGAEIMLQCPENVRMKRDHAPMEANLHRRADEANEAAGEIERLRLTAVEREAIRSACESVKMVGTEKCFTTLRGLLERLA
jgi:hypothetical protein